MQLIYLSIKHTVAWTVDFPAKNLISLTEPRPVKTKYVTYDISMANQRGTKYSQPCEQLISSTQ